MRLRFLVCTFVVVCGMITLWPGSVSDAVSTSLNPPVPSQEVVAQQLGAMPMPFTKNEGQWDERVLFRTSAGGATVWFTREGITYQFTRRIPREGTGLDDPMGLMRKRIPGSLGEEGMSSGVGLMAERDSVEMVVVTAAFEGANAAVDVMGENQLDYKCNYFIGNDPSQWRTDVPNYASVVYRDVYPGIDLRLQGVGGRLQTAWAASNGADLSQVRLTYDGNATVTETDAGELLIEAPWGTLLQSSLTTREEAPSASVESTGHAASAQASTSTVTLEYSTYLGGSSTDEGGGSAVDANGSAYVTGRTWSMDLPTAGPYQTYQGGGDAFVTKLSAAGDDLVYSTYLGGGGGEIGYRIAVHANGSAYVTGTTNSTDFPTAGPYQTHKGGYDAFVTKLSTAGNDLVYSTYLGGGEDDFGHGIAMDANGSAYVTGTTNSTDFPTTGAYQTDHAGGSGDAFVTKLNVHGNDLVYSTYLGGGEDDYGHGIAMDANGSAYVTGTTNSTDFPTTGAYQTDHAGGSGDAFVTKLNVHGNDLVYSTYLGGGDYDDATAIAVDANGSAYVTGWTGSADFPTAGPYQTDQGGVGCLCDETERRREQLGVQHLSGGQRWGRGLWYRRGRQRERLCHGRDFVHGLPDRRGLSNVRGWGCLCDETEPRRERVGVQHLSGGR